MNELGLPSMSDLSLESATNEKREMNFHDNFSLLILDLIFLFEKFE